LVKAARRWNPDVSTQFQRFAYPVIAADIERYLRHHAEIVRPSRSVEHLRAEIGTLEAEMTRRLGRNPSDPELADAAGVPATMISSRRVAPVNGAAAGPGQGAGSSTPGDLPGITSEASSGRMTDSREEPGNRRRLRRSSNRRRKTAAADGGAPLLVAVPSLDHQSS